MCFLLNLVENLHNVLQSSGGYFGFVTPKPTLSDHQVTLHFGEGLAENPPPNPVLSAAPACLA